MFLKDFLHAALFRVSVFCIFFSPLSNAGIEGLWGDNWLAFDTETKNMYVLAYLKGVDEGYRSACNRIFETSDVARRKCLDDAPNYSKPTDAYVSILDSFYSDPKVRFVFPEQVLQDLQDTKQLNLEKLRAKYSKRYPQ